MSGKRVVSVEFLQRMKRNHYFCEDSWYSCPKAEDGCSNEAVGTDCDCGADKFNLEIDFVIQNPQQRMYE